MGKKLTDILPKISQWESIPYVGDFNCPIVIKVAFITFMEKQGNPPMLLGGVKLLLDIWAYLNVLSALKNTDSIVLSDKQPI